MDYKIYIKKKLSEKDYPSFYIVFSNKTKYICLELSDYEINLKSISYEDLLNNYIELKDFITNSEYIGMIDNISKSTILFTYDNKISIVKDEFVALDYEEQYELNGVFDYGLCSYEDVSNAILKRASEVIKDSFIYLIKDIFDYFNDEQIVEDITNQLDFNISKKRYYEILLNLPEKYNKNMVKKYAKMYLKNISNVIKNSKLKDNMVNETLDAYNYLTKKLSKKI